MNAVGDRITCVFGLHHVDERHARHALELAEILALRPAIDASQRGACGWCIGVTTAEIERCNLADSRDVLFGPAGAAALSLDEIAPPGRIVIDAATEDRVRQWWVTATVAPVPPGRLAEPLAVFRVRRRRKDSVLLVDGPIVGRKAERETLANAWNAAIAKGTRPLFIHGTAGMGKSRLVREMRRIAADADWIELRCTLERQTVPLSGLVSLIQALHADSVTLARRYGLADEDAVPVLATLLGEPMPDGYAMPPVTPERYRELVARAALELLIRAASDGPTVIVAEDLHWADPSTLEVLAALVAEVARRAESGPPLSLLLLMTSRPGLDSTWNPDGLDSIDLAPMPADELEDMIRVGLASSAGMDRRLVVELADASGGLPLFIEQATRLIRNRIAAANEERTVPHSMESVLAAQLDLLSENARTVAQFAAAVGQYFDADIVGAAAAMPASIVDAALVELDKAGIVFRSAGDPRSAYAFTHILIRDAAYRSVCDAERPALHRSVADVMERDHPHIGLQRPAELALQRELAGEPSAAAELWHRSGMQALANAGYTEACEDLARGIRLLEPTPASSARTMRLLGLYTALGSAHVMTKGFSAPEARRAFQTANRMCSHAGRDVPVEVLGGVFGSALVAANREETDAVLPHFRALSQRTDSPWFAFAGHQVLSVEAYWNGRMNEAWEHAETSMSLYRREALQGVAWEFGFGIHCYAYGMLSQFHRGFLREAEAIRLEMLDRAQRNGNPHCVAVALGWSTVLLLASKRAQETIDESNRLIRLAGEQHLPLWATYAAISRGTMQAETGDASAAVPAVGQAVATLEAFGEMASRVGYSPYWARVLMAAGDFDGALAEVRHGMACCGRMWTRVQEPELVRLHAVLLERMGRVEEADREYRRALTIARADGNLAAERWIVESAPSLASVQG